MAPRLISKKSGGEKPAARKATPKKEAASGHAAANGPAAPARAKPATKAKAATEAKAKPATEVGTTSRSRKPTTVNAETAEVLRDAEAGKNLLHYPSLEAMFEDLGI